MHIAILSRSKGLHSIQRLLREALRARIRCDVINPLDCQLIVDGVHSRILVGGRLLPRYDVVLPRIGTSITNYGLAVVKQFETLGMFVINPSRAISDSRDKMRSLQILTQASLHVPATALTRSLRHLRSSVQAVKGMPLVMKTLQGTQGVGVMLMHTPISVGSVIETLRALDQDVILQQFVLEGAGRDYRAFVIGNRVVAAMMRTAPAGDFRSNIHRGGEGKPVVLPRRYESAALKAAKTLGLEIAGVDLMESHRGPLVIEVNSSPGFEGIEEATGLNIAKMIIQFMVREGKKRRRTKYTKANI